MNNTLVENFIKDILENIEVRQCNICNSYMIEGFCIEEGLHYYCSESCMHKDMTEEEFLFLYDDGNGDSYWTEWEENINEYNALKEILSRFKEIKNIKLK